MIVGKRYKKPRNVNLKLFKKKLQEEQTNKEKVHIPVKPNPKCDLCHGEGRVATLSNKIPGMTGNVNITSGKIRLMEFCPKCVISKAQKLCKEYGVVEGEQFDIDLVIDTKRVDPLAQEELKVVEPDLEEVKDNGK